jgi:rubredoxin
MQFFCPLGHLLECSESRIGQRSRCPTCGAEFVVPKVVAAPNEQSRSPTERQTPELPAIGPSFSLGSVLGGTSRQGLETETPLIRRPSAVFASETATAATSAPVDEERLVHIPCPAGHELETPFSMIGQDVMCPICRAEFRLHYNRSREYRAEQQQQRQRREQKLGRTWMTWSLVAAALVLCGFALMIAISMSR